ncbi:Fibroblast growth factor receptor 4 [Desmophyllum pertusum]|uniref:Fibroblast growth factor receptor 4 n=1 Tax=Desmophyllum pertusum TaxID=174260 RepID=A0A9W9YH26_9CNID|nr:Fibroblast growth factor receptor 4 [Desmophyllum pertusum]
MGYASTTSSSSSSESSGAAQASPRFVDSIRMQQTFIAWPARHNVRLKCRANGSSPLRFQWLKDGDPSVHRRLQPRLKTNMWYLKLKDLVPLDSGKYTCVVSNAYGSINHTYTLRVVEKSRTKPILKCGSPKNTSVQLGHNASMTCIVLISGTLPDFRWVKWNTVPSTYPSSLDFENGTYTLVNPVQYQTVHVGGKYGVKVNIKNVTPNDLGLYTCYVSNHLGSDYRSAFLSERKDKWKEDTTARPEKTYLAKSHQNTASPPSREPNATMDKPSSKPVLTRSREAKIPLSVFIGVLSTWAVITTLALLWCHLYHKKTTATKPGIEI